MNTLCLPQLNIINDMLNLPRDVYFRFDPLDDYLVITFDAEMTKAACIAGCRLPRAARASAPIMEVVG